MTDSSANVGIATPRRGTAWEIFRVALRLGLTSFGGPVAHIGYFQDEYVERRRWVDDETFADLVALSQSFPGAASSQLGLAIGMVRGGLSGGIAAWLGFTLPSAVVMTVLGLTASRLSRHVEGWIHGLVVVAVPVVGLAVWKLWRRLAPDPFRSSMAAAGAAVLIAFPSSNRTTTVLVIAAGGLVGWLFLRENVASSRSRKLLPFGRRMGAVAAVLFFGLIVALPILRSATENESIDVADAFYGTGALVFGGGPVVLPLLESEVVEPRLGRRGHVHRRIRRGPSGTGPAVHLLGIPGGGDGSRTQRDPRSGAGPGGPVPAVGPDRGGHASLVGGPP